MEYTWTGSSAALVSGSRARQEVGAAPGPLLNRRSQYRLRDGDGDSESRARLIVVMGVSGTGKSTLGKALAESLGLPFVDGDDLHPAANVAKMARGEPLDDGDRWPWLERIREWAVECVGMQVRAGAETGTGQRRLGVIAACSALKRTYRAVLRGESPQGSSALDTCFVYLKGEREVLMARMQSREGHFMKAGMLDSQLETLESPEGEPGVVTVSVEMSTEEQAKTAVEALVRCC